MIDGLAEKLLSGVGNFNAPHIHHMSFTAKAVSAIGESNAGKVNQASIWVQLDSIFEEETTIAVCIYFALI